ncbi:PTS sugar transporter subunit IIC [Aerococcaceae bacterium zg-ZJ1578]|uniref:PTS sugar transporter subunit IIC n=1 Tax=Aerococcaceae bacterium zg-252 TaxID=2796928 RepID=UPI001A337C81|nr:PTS sugar transporter subunit IIC [Aerococcaceae bacterium zg-1578]
MDNKLFKSIMRSVTAFSNNKYVKAVSDSMMTLIGLMILGSFAVIFQAFPVKFVSEFFASIGIAPYFGIIYRLTIGSIALYLVFLIAKNLVSKFDVDVDASTVGLVAIMSFLILTPLDLIAKENSNIMALPLTWLGTSGMFSAIIIGLSVAKLYALMKENNWSIKMPDGVPPMVSKSFENLIPTVVIGVLSAVLAFLFNLTSFGNIHQIVYTVIQAPLNGLGGSMVAVVFIIAFQQLLWFFGIHGTNVISPIVGPIWLSLAAENLDAFQAGKELPHIVTQPLINIVCWGGSALGLVLLMIFVGKSKRYKELGKIAIMPALFGVTEPVIFGTPLVLNFNFFVPFVFNNSINLILTFILIKLGILAPAIGAQAVFGLPLGFHASIGGSMGLIIWQLIVQLIISPILWLPWFKHADNLAVQEENLVEGEK